MIVAGIDAGSRAIKIVLLDAESRELLAHGLANQGVAQSLLAEELLEKLLAERELARSNLARVVATGYGRNIIKFCDRAITEITCHSAGVHHQLPEARTIVEIGGQDSKVMRLEPSGAVRDFNMNDRCAAGTGRFLEVVAVRLELELEDLGQCALSAAQPAAISSMCVVFAETEIVGLLASGISPADIAAGVQAAIATRTAALVGRSALPPVAFTGGVALIPGMAEALERALGSPVIIPPRPQMSGALGAALLAADQVS